jgi:hypothetical protein
MALTSIKNNFLSLSACSLLVFRNLNTIFQFYIGWFFQFNFILDGLSSWLVGEHANAVVAVLGAVVGT